MQYLKNFRLQYAVFVFLTLGSIVCNAATNTSGFIKLSVDKQKISAEISQASLAKILGELAKFVPIKVIFNGDGANDRVSVQFRSLSFWQALQHILENNYVIESPHFSVSAEFDGKLLKNQTVIRILNRSPTTALRDGFDRGAKVSNNTSNISSDDQSDISKLSKNAIEGELANSRVQALDALALNYADEENRTLVAQVFDKALTDPEPAVRKAAFQIVTENAIAISDRSLIDVAGNDSDPEIRLGTLYEIANRTNPVVTRAFLEKAQNDPDERVSQAATQLLLSSSDKIPY